MILLENGVTQRGIEKVNRIQHELLKLKKSYTYSGVKKSERKSSSNSNKFINPYYD